MSDRNKKYAGFFSTEIAVALAILGILLAGLALSLSGLVKFNRYQLVRQRCIAAAEAQLDSIAAVDREIGDEDFKRLWPELSVSIQQQPATGRWEGMKLVKVETGANFFGKEVKVQLCRYILGGPILQYNAKWEPLAE